MKRSKYLFNESIVSELKRFRTSSTRTSVIKLKFFIISLTNDDTTSPAILSDLLYTNFVIKVNSFFYLCYIFYFILFFALNSSGKLFTFFYKYNFYLLHFSNERVFHCGCLLNCGCCVISIVEYLHE